MIFKGVAITTLSLLLLIEDVSPFTSLLAKGGTRQGTLFGRITRDDTRRSNISSLSMTSTSTSSSTTTTTTTSTTPRTLYDKIWDDHVVDKTDSSSSLLYIDRHLVHEVTSPQAFEGLRLANRNMRRPDCTLATVDHNVPTSDRSELVDVTTFIEETASRTQVMCLERNVRDFGVTYFGLADERQGVVHIIGPEQGFTLPGTTCVCGDSHTATHGAFGAMAFGIGTSEVEHVLATQTLTQTKSKNMLIQIEGMLPIGVTSKDIVLHICGLIGTAGGTGYTIEFAGSTIRSMSMEARMSVSNMAIEAGARAGIIAPDEVTYAYLKGRPMSPSTDTDEWDLAVEHWKSHLHTDEGAVFDKTIHIDAYDVSPTVSWGTSPQDVLPIHGHVPDPDQLSQDEDQSNDARRAAMIRSLQYIGLSPGQAIRDIPIERVFVGSCTNGRIEDLRNAAAVAVGRRVAPGVHAMIVPGSGLVKLQAEAEGLDRLFVEAGFDWREPGCSMCLAMNPDKLRPQERCASTSNRNFEGRQGNGGRTHLMSPAMAAAAACAGKIVDVREYEYLGAPQNDPRLIGADDDITRVQSKAFTTTSFVNPGPIIDPIAPYQLEQEKSKISTSAPLSPGGDIAQTPADAVAGIPKVTIIKGVAAALDIQNIDTDMIIPKEFLKTIQRAGLGFAAFAELRYHNPDQVALLGEEVAQPRDDFVLNQPGYDQQKTKILITGDNFGCGSSREHAPWSINDMGIQCIISTSFADIFYNNCFNNGMLPIALPREEIEMLMDDVRGVPGTELTVDLPNQKVIRPDGKGSFDFEINEFKKHCLLHGLDKIGITLQKKDVIRAFEMTRSQNFPWLDGATRKVPDVVPMYPEANYWSTSSLDSSTTIS